MRIIFCGTPDYAVPSLRRLASLSGHELVAVVSQPDRPKGRSGQPTPPPAVLAARELGLRTLQPESFNAAPFLEQLRGLEPDLFCVVAYGQLLKKAALAVPRLLPLNAHGSLLPKFRGAAPIQGVLLAGEKESGVTIMRMERGLDKGPWLLKRALPIAPAENAETLHDKLALLSADCFAEALELLAAGRGAFTPQDEASASYAPKLEKSSGRIEWTRDAVQLDRLVRALNPWPGTWTAVKAAAGSGRQRIRIVQAAPVAPESATPGAGQGRVIEVERDAVFEVGCGAGALRVSQVQPEGKRAMSVAEFLHGAGRALGGESRWE